jgi:transcriptional regulator with PAS, ATPase and Fis domain
MIGDSDAMRNVRRYLERVATTNTNILITGETGTGKELAAEFVHRHSPRRSRPFIAINCAAIPDGLLESELFGYERGAFTGAHSSSEGKLKAAQGGTVFLDEVADLSLYGQAKLLRAIDSKEIHPLGSTEGAPVNIRIIAATNQDLEKLVREEKFRKDLYFRLNVARVHLPALRDRKQDIPAIVNHYLADFNRRFGTNIKGLAEPAWEYFLAYDWPGNVRELKNVLEVLSIHAESSEISVADLPIPLRLRSGDQPASRNDERTQLVAALLSTNWNKSKAAERLHWSRMTLYRKMAKYQVLKAAG